MALVRQAAALLAAVAGVACGRGAPRPAAAAPEAAPADSPASVFSPASAGIITLLNVELPDAGATVGAHYQGYQYDRLRGTIQLAEGTRQRWMRAARDAGDAALLAAGFNIRPAAPPSSDAEPLRGVRFGLSAQVTRMELKTTGYVEPYVIEGSVRVDWDLLDLATGASVFEGSSAGSVHGADSLQAAMEGAVRGALAHLVAQRAFQRAIMAPRPLVTEDLLVAEFARAMPGPRDTIRLEGAAQQVSADVGIMGGVAQLNGSRGFRTTALVLTRDGLALAPASAGRQRWLWAKHNDGRHRAARVVRTAGEVTLIELSCPDGCATVAWALDTTLANNARVIWYGSASGGPLVGVRYGERKLRVRRDRDGVLAWTLSGRRLPGGEGVARTPDGLLVGVVTRSGVMPLAGVFEQLGIRASN